MIEKLTMNAVFDGLQPSSTLYINETVNRMWQQGQPVYHLGFGESRFPVHPLLKKALQTHADQKSYLPARGLPELTEAVAEYYTNKLRKEVGEHQVIIGPGSKLLLYAVQLALDADIFLPAPAWVSYAPQATLSGNRFTYIPSTPEDNYQLKISSLDELIQASEARTRVLIINSPNNPTGQMLRGEFLKRLADYCRANEVLVVSDEIYFQLTHGKLEHCSIANYYPQGTIVMGGLSKHLSLGGWRLGVGILPNNEVGKALMSKLVVTASETWSGVAAPIQYAAIQAYRSHAQIEQYITDCAAIHGIRTRFIAKYLRSLGVHCSRSEGAFYIAANFDFFAPQLAKLGVSTSAELAIYLLEKYCVATLPGVDFGLSEKMLSLRLATSYLDMESNAAAQKIYDIYKTGISSKAMMSASNHPQTHAACQTFAKFIEDLTARA